MKLISTLWVLNLVLSIVNAILGFISGNIMAGLGWSVATMAWIIVLIKEFKELSD